MAASIATMTLKPLNEAELNFVNKQVNGAFLHKFGSTQGFGMFCNVAKQQGFKCAGGPQAKGSYATYLKNAKAGTAVTAPTLFSQMTAAYGTLDGFTKAAMAKKITKGKALQSKTFNTGCFTKFTVAELHEIAGLAGVKVSGNKANICAQLKKSGVPLDTLWAGTDVTITPQASQAGPAAWEAYASRTKKRGRVPRSYAQIDAYTSAAPSDNGGLTDPEIAFWDKLNGAS